MKTSLQEDRVSTSRPGMAALASILVLVLLAAGISPAAADSDVEILKAEAVSEFPDGFRFRVEARATAAIEEILVRFQVAGRSANQYNYLELEDGAGVASGDGRRVAGEYFHRTNSRDRYSPPGTKVRYWFEITGENGDTVTTEPSEFVYMDARFEWETVEEGPVTVFYHGPVETRAGAMAETAAATIQNVGPVLGVNMDRPLRIVMYNNNAEMLGALAPRSSAISRELITEGQAFAEQGVVLLLGSGRRAKGTISHELTHVLVHRATPSAVRPVPLWLNEGLAEFGNVDQGISYDRFLEWAVDTRRLTPLESLNQFPGDPNLVIVSYGQSKSVVAFMIEEWGADRMRKLLARYNAGGSFESALQEVYGLTTRELDNRWRESQGAKLLRAEEDASADLPDAKPTTTALLPLTLDQIREAGAEKTATPGPGQSAIPTATLEPTPTEENAAPAPEATAEEPTTPSRGGACSAPSGPGARPEAASMGLSALPALLSLLAWRRRSRFLRKGSGRDGRTPCRRVG